jgi:hypothetical protein
MTIMGSAWKTKYGKRRVKNEPPTLEDAIFAARGLADNLQQQVEIAASLIGLPHEEVRAAVLKSNQSAKQLTLVQPAGGRAQRTVVVERITSRRPGDKRRFGS